jgi:hypothetical protein
VRAPAPAAAAGTGGETVGAAATTGGASGIAQSLLNKDMVKVILAPFLAAPAAPDTGLVPHLRISSNDVEILPIDPKQMRESLSGIPPLTLYISLPPDRRASTAVGANCLRGGTPASYIAVVMPPGVLTVTGNMFLNAAGSQLKAMSLLARIDGDNVLMNVRGNCFLGFSSITPSKPPDAGCHAGLWDDLNSTRSQ